MHSSSQALALCVIRGTIELACEWAAGVLCSRRGWRRGDALLTIWLSRSKRGAGSKQPPSRQASNNAPASRLAQDIFIEGGFNRSFYCSYEK